MKVVLASVSFTSPYTAQRRMLSLGYIHAQAVSDPFINARTEIVHNFYDCSIHDAEYNAKAILKDDSENQRASAIVKFVDQKIGKAKPALQLKGGGSK